MGDMTIPFIMLLIITVALFLERKYHEETVRKEFEEDFKNVKDYNSTNGEEKKCKELVGLVFLEDSKLNIEVINKKIIDKLERKKYNIKA
ncbi:MAG: hypothetical protein U9R39_01580 [Campylobacterota bacterium]|nr:hypothetical protein [Campylobacterota bacterium]